MIIELFDWHFRVDVKSTQARTRKNSTDHCTCAYCRNYYDAMDRCYLELRAFLGRFGIDLHGPSELMPFTPTLMLACYRVQGQIVKWGREALSVDRIPIVPESSDCDSFLLWVGEIPIPWLQEEDMDEVISPANLPEFLERMEEVWLQRHGESLFFS